MASKRMRIGHGYDAHRFTAGRKLILCGVNIPFEKGLAGHSDADVAAHAVMDALLGAAALGDIGLHFPDSDARYKDAVSVKLLSAVAALVDEHGYLVENLDITIIAEAPKLSPYYESMRANIARACGTEIDRISVKATTEEGLGFGTAGISAHAVVLLNEKFRTRKL